MNRQDQPPHMLFIPPAPVSAACSICGRPGHDLQCERCGAPVHGECYWQRAASTEERRLYDAAPVETYYFFLCPGCRA